MKVFGKFSAIVLTLVFAVFIIAPILLTLAAVAVPNLYRSRILAHEVPVIQPYALYGNAAWWQDVALGLTVMVVLAGLFVCLGIAAWRLLAGQTARSTERFAMEESRIMQDIYRGLTRLETRVESLETLLLDRPHARSVHSEHGIGN